MSIIIPYHASPILLGVMLGCQVLIHNLPQNVLTREIKSLGDRFHGYVRSCIHWSNGVPIGCIDYASVSFAQIASSALNGYLFDPDLCTFLEVNISPFDNFPGTHRPTNQHRQANHHRQLDENFRASARIRDERFRPLSERTKICITNLDHGTCEVRKLLPLLPRVLFLRTRIKIKNGNQ
jgi:hypothetical protein